MIWLLTAGLLSGAVMVAWPDSVARERLPGLRGTGRAGFDPAWLRRTLPAALPRSSRRAVPAMSALLAGPALLLGGPVAAGIAAVYGGLAARELVRRAVRKRVAAGRTAADLLERIEADARTSDRAARTAAAQAAGAQATAFLLAALPIGGIGLGYAIGADPLTVLLHTPAGAVCAVVAVVLQCIGLRWAQQLAEGAGR
jgi:tight adherence protein B